ncbi:MAG: primosomal protein N' [bacterium]|nr:primosomal protein N' [bacterium]
MPLIYDILIDRNASKDLIFSYSSGEPLNIGDYVAVPLKGHLSKGYVIDKREIISAQDFKMVLGKIFDIPLVSPYLLDLAYWISEYYICNLSQALSTVIPPEVRNVKVTYDKELRVKLPKPRKRNLEKAYVSYIELSNSNTSPPENFSRLLIRFPIEKRLDIYLKLIEREISNNKSVILLFPELDTLLSVEDIFREVYGKELALIHSRQSPAVKNEEWWRIRNHNVKLVLGTRSAVFSPVENLGLIIIDGEENDGYKDESRPLYDARRVAYKIQELVGCKLVFGSSAPTLETYKGVLENGIDFFTEEETRDLTNIRPVNMKGKKGFISRELIHYCKVSLSKKKQIIILINRKGYFTLGICEECGNIVKCLNCNMALVYHKDEGFVCHYCGYNTEKIERCPQCGGKINLLGYGNERILEILKKILPKAKITKMDADLSDKEIDKIWRDFIDGNIDILVGTQIIAKGFRLPNVALAGVLAPDLALNLPDFKASEKVFRLIYNLAEQVKENKYLVIQSMLSNYYAIKYASKLDYQSFYKYELQLRRSLGYPPYNHILRIIISGKKEDEVKTIAISLASDIKRKLGVDYSGPAKCPLYKIKGVFHWHILLKVKEINRDLSTVVKELVEAYNYRDINITVDVDPVSTV